MASDARTGLFLQKTPLFDVGDLTNEAQGKQLIVNLSRDFNDAISAINLKETGYYVLEAFCCGQVFFANPNLTATTPQTRLNRQVFRKVINFGPLPNTALASVPHGLVPTALWSFTRIYATASDPVGLNYIPIPYASPVLANNIEINVDAVNVNIITGSNRTNFTICYVILEWLEN